MNKNPSSLPYLDIKLDQPINAYNPNVNIKNLI